MLKISINFGGRTKDGGNVDDDVGESVMLSSRRVRVGEKRDAVYAYGWSYDQTNMIRDRRKEARGGREVRRRDEHDDMMTLIHMCPAVDGEDRRPVWHCALPNGTYTVNVQIGDPSFPQNPSTLIFRCPPNLKEYENKVGTLNIGETRIVSTTLEVKGNEIQMYVSGSEKDFKTSKRCALRLNVLTLSSPWKDLGTNPPDQMLKHFFKIDELEEEQVDIVDYMMRGPVDSSNEYLVPYVIMFEC